MSDWTVKGRTVLITGGNSGIGKATATALARHGANVVITSRDEGAGERAAADIAEQAGTSVEVLPLDLASFASIRSCAAAVSARFEDLAVLIDNAGVFIGRRRLTAEGFEMTFGVNHLGHFLLTCLLFDRLQASAPSRIITVSSGAHHRAAAGLDMGDLNVDRRRYRAVRAYSDSKLANVLFTRELARRLDGTGVTAYVLHPGVVATRMAQDGDTRVAGYFWKLAKPFQISPTAGATTSVYLATEPEIESHSGDYFSESRPAPVSRAAGDDATARRLWELSEAMTGCRLDAAS
jgi:NAD(P)-dependent dehydrogenase (short-subunit alcohol dehydrogenase family)